jgi:hypothetical protein
MLVDELMLHHRFTLPVFLGLYVCAGFVVLHFDVSMSTLPIVKMYTFKMSIFLSPFYVFLIPPKSPTQEISSIEIHD